MPPTVTEGNPVLDEILKNFEELKARHAGELAACTKLCGEQSSKIDELQAEHVKAVAEFRGQAARIAAIDARVAMDPAEVKRFSIAKCVQAAFADHASHKAGRRDRDAAWKALAPFEYDVVKDAERIVREQYDFCQKTFGESERFRDLGSTVDSTGGALIPTPVAQEYLGLLRPQMVLPDMGAKFLTGLMGNNVPISVGMTAGVTSYWLGETGTPTSSTPTFEVRQLRPHRISTYVPVANNLLRWSPMAVEQFVKEDMVRSMAQEWETQLLFNLGTGEYKPRGLRSFASIQTNVMGANGSRFTHAELDENYTLLATANVPIDEASTGFICHPLILRRLRLQGVEQFTSQGVDNGQPLVWPYRNQGDLEKVLGKHRSSSIVPTGETKGSSDYASPVLFGNWRFYTIGQWGGVRLRASDIAGGPSGSAFLQDQTWIVADLEVDGLPTRENAFVYTADAVTQE